MTQGYLIYAHYNEEDIKAAYALAASIKLNDDREVALMTHKFDNVPTKYEDVFDYIVELPYGDVEHTYWNKDVNIWQAYHCTPFDETMYVDKNAMLLSNIDDYWGYLSNFDIVAPTVTTNFQGDTSEYEEKFKVQEKNKLPTYCADVLYFKKSEVAAEVFKMLDVVSQNWRTVYAEFVKELRPEDFRTGLTLSLLHVMLDQPLCYCNDLELYTDITLDNMLVDDEDVPEMWTDYLNSWLYNGQQLKINNHKQTGLVVYHYNDFLTTEYFDDIKQRYKDAKKKASI